MNRSIERLVNLAVPVGIGLIGLSTAVYNGTVYVFLSDN